MIQPNTLKVLLLASEIQHLYEQEAKLSNENAIKILLLADMIRRIAAEDKEAGEREGEGSQIKEGSE